MPAPTERNWEEALRDELGLFFVPLPPLEEKDNPRVKAKALYVIGNIAGLERRFTEILNLVEATELNALVIDVKNDHGVMSYRSSIEIVQEAGANRNVPIKDISAVMEKRETYSLQSTGFAMGHEAHRQWFNGWTGRLRSHVLKDRVETAGVHAFTVDMTISVDQVAHELEDVPFEVFLENQIWRVKPGEAFLEKLTHEETGAEGPPGE